MTTKDSYFKGDEDSRLIPRKFQCDNAIRLEASCSFATTASGNPISGMYYGTLLVIKDDNTIELFGDNTAGACDQTMDIINGTSAGNQDNNTPETVIEVSTTYPKEQCEKTALDYMKTHISQYLKNPSSLQINGTSCIKGEGTTYWVTIDYSAMNSFGGYERNQYYCQVDYTTGEVIDGGII